MDRWQYLIVLAACLLITAPLEVFGAGVYRQPRRLLYAVSPVAVVFVCWDLLAIVADVWTYNARYLTGVEIFGVIPLEELLFFLVIPICGLLTFSAVEHILSVLARIRGRKVRSR